MDVTRQSVKKVTASAFLSPRSYKKCLNLLMPGALSVDRRALRIVSESV